MAAKVLEVHLVGEGVSLERAFAGSAKSATAAASTIEASGARIAASGKRISAVGKTWTHSITLPLLAIGGLAVKSAFEFEKSMSLISTEAGGTRKEVDRLEKRILGLAKATQWSPKQLADGLYHIESSGYRGAKAIDILNVSQKLATAGNSELEETTYALVSAVKALGTEGYGPTNKVAAELNAIIGHGDMRLSELVQALSSGVIPTAVVAGMGLRDVGSALDVMTSRGEPAQVAATRLRMTFSLLSAPTDKAKDALKGIGIASLDLARIMRKEGIGPAVKFLAEHLERVSKTKANQILSSAFGGGRSSGAIKTLVLNWDELLKKEAEIGKGVHNYNREVKEAEERNMTKMKKSWSSIQASLVEIGMAVGPAVLEIFQEIAGAIGSITESFSGLDAGTQKIIVTAAFGAAAMGPLLIVGGKVVTTWGRLIETVGKARTALAAMAVVETAVVSSGEATVAANELAATSYMEVATAAEAAGAAQVAAAQEVVAAQEIAAAKVAAAGGAEALSREAAIARYGSYAGGKYGITKRLPTQQEIGVAKYGAPPGFYYGQQKMDLAHSAETGGQLSLLGTSAKAETAAVEGAAATAGARSGTTLAKNLVKGFASKVGPLAAAAGLADIVIHATQGDWKSVGYEAGGSVVGGIAGFFLGGPAGAMLGAGIGAFGGDLIKKLFGGGDGALSAFQHNTQEVIKHAIAGRRVFARSSHLVVDAENRLENIGKRQAHVIDRITETQQRLNNARKNGNLPVVRREEAKLNELKAKQIALTHRQWNAETLLHSAKVKNEQDARRIRTTEVALVRTREVQFEQSKKHERQTQKEFEQAVRQQKPLKEINEKEKDLIQAQKRRKGSSEKLQGAEKELGGTMKEITNKFGKKFADQLREQIPLWKSTAAQMKRSEGAMHTLAPSVSTLNQTINKYKSRQKEARAATEAATGPLYKLGNRAKETGQKIQHAKTEVVSGFSGMEAKGTNFLQALKVQSPFSAPAKASGGYMVRGHGLQDTVPVTNSDVAAMVAPGEMLAVINRHQAPLINQAVTNEYGVNGLGGFFNTFDKPHYMATGGLLEPKIQSGGAFRKGEQKEVNTGFKALNKYLKAHAEPPRIAHALHAMEAQAHKGYPYVYGGGHGSFSGPFDCSGYVSYGLHAAGFLDTPMSTQQGSGLNTLGAAGPGKYLTWGVRGSSGMNAHTMMSIKNPKGKWKYFEAGGSGGGAHEDSGWDGSFSFRHMPGFASGGIIPTKAAEKIKKYGPEATDPSSPHFIGWGFNKGGIVNGSAPRFAKGGVKGPWAGSSIDRTYPKSDGISQGETLPGYVIKALAEWSGLPGVTMFQITEGESTGHPGMDIPDPPGRSRGLYAVNDHYNPQFGATAMRNPILNTLAAKQLADASGGPNAGIWHGSSHVTSWNAHFSGDITAIAKHAGGTGDPKDEVVPGVFKGAKTHSLSFPSVPKTLPAIKREINKWQKEAENYRRAIDSAKKKPKTQRALQANLTKIENFLRQLYAARTHVRFEKAKKKLHTKTARQLGKLTGKEAEIEKIERAYDEADQTAGQVVELEPQPPRSKEALNSDDQNEVQRVEAENKKTEEDYVHRFQEYVDNQERHAYEKVLFIETNWRNKIIEAERFATGLEQHWETESRSARVHVEGINRYTDKVAVYIDKVKDDIQTWQKTHPKKGPKDYPDWIKKEIQERDLMVGIRDRERAKLPMLRERDRSFSTVLGEGREHFYGGDAWVGSGKDFQPPGEAAYPGTGSPLNPPKPPAVGTGTLEEALINVQGSHWPDQHDIIGTLPAKREAGQLGGVIWDTQTAVEELSLKMSEAPGSGGGGGGGGSGSSAADELASEKLQLTEEALLRERQRSASLEATAATMRDLGRIGPKDFKATFPWAGRYAAGGPVAALVGEEGPEIALMDGGGTHVTDARKTEELLTPQIQVINHIHGDEVDTEVLVNGKQMDAIVETVKERIGQSTNHLAQNVSTGRLGTFHD